MHGLGEDIRMKFRERRVLRVFTKKGCVDGLGNAQLVGDLEIVWGMYEQSVDSNKYDSSG